jgi:uncharacterized protein
MTDAGAHQHGAALDFVAWPQDTVVFAGILAIMLVFLSVRVSRLRFRHRVGIGDGGKADLARAIRVQGNFAEYVPIALVLLLLVELAGYLPWVVQVLGGALVLGRLLHAFGLSRSSGESPARALGMILTLAVLAACGVLCLWAWVGGFLPAD